MGSLTTRGRVLVVVAFVLAAGLCASAAVAFVIASDESSVRTRALPTVSPTARPSAAPTPAPTTPAPVVTASPTPVTVTPTPTVTAVPSATVSPAPRRTTSPRPTATSAVVEGLGAEFSLNIGTGGTTDDTYVVTVHAHDGSGTIYLESIDWGDEPPATLHERGAACNPPAVAPADCRNYTGSHTYTAAGTYIITIELVSGTENATRQFTVKVDPAPAP